MAKKAVKVHVNRKLVELDRVEGNARDLLLAAGFIGEEYDVFLLTHGEDDPSGGQLLGLDEPFRFESGQHFRVLPANRNFGALR